MSENIFTQVVAILSDVLGVIEGRINADSSPETIEEWDSVAQLNIVLAVEEKFDVRLTPEDIDKILNVKALVAILEEKGAK